MENPQQSPEQNAQPETGAGEQLQPPPAGGPQAPPPPPAPTPMQPPEVPVIPPNAEPTPAPTSSAPAITGPALADDVDVIEKEWVDKAQRVVKSTEGDPHKEEEAVEDLQIDYLKKRYNVDVKKSKES